MMSHHPSSADPVDARSASMGARYPDTATLAAFRRSIQEASAHPSQYGYDRNTFMGHPGATYASAGVHAWPDELRHGIGYRYGHSFVTVDTIAGPMRDDPPAKYARWCASALRSRAYARGIGSLADIVPDYWDDEAPRAPLPITYRSAFTITR